MDKPHDQFSSGSWFLYSSLRAPGHFLGNPTKQDEIVSLFFVHPVQANQVIMTVAWLKWWQNDGTSN